MPKKNNQNKPNGFLLYAQEIKNELLREGHSIRTTADLISASAPRWETLPANEKEYYKDKAKWEWENRHTTGNYPKRPFNRRDCTGAVISNRVDVVSLNEAKRKREREEVYMSFPKGKAVLEKKFYFISFICLLEEPAYQAVEVAAVQFSLLNGIEKSWHKFINPGPIPMGFRFKAQNTSETTHKIPCEGLARPEDTYTRIYDELFHFLSQGTNMIPPIHVKKSETERTDGCLKWLAQKAGRQNQLRRIYELEGLILDLDSYLNEEPQNFAQSLSVATDLISSTIFDWDFGTRCEWHEENEAKDCALGNVNRYCFCMADYFCEPFEIPVTDRHLPTKSAEPCYMLIKSKANSQQQSRYTSRAPSKAVSRAELADMDQDGGEDIASRVANQLKIEQQQRAMAEEEEAREERERIQKEEEQKKRWQALRGGAPNSPPKSAPVLPHTNVVSQSVGVNTSNQTRTSSAKNVGRGRGRGVVNLRRPGEAPRTVGAASHQTTAVNESTVSHPPPGLTTNNNSTVRRPPPGLGRGIAAPPGLGRATSSYNNKNLFANTAPPPCASAAPIPPNAWLPT